MKLKAIGLGIAAAVLSSITFYWVTYFFLLVYVWSPKYLPVCLD